MLKFFVLGCLLVSGVTCEGWQPDYEYTYEIKGRRLQKVGKVYNGTQIKDLLQVLPKQSGKIKFEIRKGKYVEIDSKLLLNWNADLPEIEKSKYKSLPLSDFPLGFKLDKENQLVFGKDLSQWEESLVTKVAGFFQTSRQQTNGGDKANGGAAAPGSQCETKVEVEPLPKPDDLDKKLGLVMPVGGNSFMSIVQTTDFSKCRKKQRARRHEGQIFFGLDTITEEKYGRFLKRESNSRINILGSLAANTIYSAEYTEKIVLDPMLHKNTAKAYYINVNLTLKEVRLPCSAGEVNDCRKTKEKSSTKDQQENNKEREDLADVCTRNKTKVIEEGRRVCFSMRPLPTCIGQCRPGDKIEEEVPFFCVQASETSRLWQDMVEEGSNPDLSSQSYNKKLTVKIPDSCQE